MRGDGSGAGPRRTPPVARTVLPVTSPGIEQRQAQLRREQEAFRGAEQPLREAIATMLAAIERWRADFTEANRQAAWAATGFVVEDEMAVLVAHARNAATTADGFLPDGVVKRMWRVVAELEHEHARALLYFRQLEQTPVPDQTTAVLPLQPATLDRILANWPE